VTIPVEPEERGGFRKPVSVEQFVIGHLQQVGEDYASAIHKAYKKKLGDVPLPLRRHGNPYKACTYYSFTRQLQSMELKGIIIESDRVEVSDSLHTQHWLNKPKRKYYRLK
jgi:hypothetical protein